MEKKKFLVVVDVQNDFIDGSLRNEEAIKKVPNIVKKIKEFDGDFIFATMDTHPEHYLKTSEGEKLPVEHCIKGTEGWKINKDVKNALDESKVPVIFIEKPTFGSYDLVRGIEKVFDHDVCGTDIEFVGFCTDICVVSNVLLVKAAFFETANISVDASCCAGVTPESHKAALETMQMCQINILNEDE